MWWIIILFLSFARTEDALEKFKQCNKQQCILVRCYFPLAEFLNTTRNEIKPFKNFIEQNHIFIDYHLCNDLSSDNMDEVGACMYGVLFKFDANSTVHQRIHAEEAFIQDESVALVMDMLSNILYRIRKIDKKKELEKVILRNRDVEDTVVINAHSLSAQQHLSVSRIILNFGPWFTFIYSIVNTDDELVDCLYRIYQLDSDISTSQCATQNDIHMILEKRIGTRALQLNNINLFSDLTHINTLKRTLPMLFYIHANSNMNLISNERIIIIPVNTLDFNAKDIENYPFLQGPYPFYLFWSAKKNIFQRLGDQPSNELLDILLKDEQEKDLLNVYGMFDDEVRSMVDECKQIEINSNILFLKNSNDYHHFQEIHSKSAILFTVKWDSTSILARKTFHEIASSLSNHLSMIDIDCFDWTDICNRENIFEWPTLILMENKTRKILYEGSTNKNEMLLALFRFSVKQPYLIEDDSSQTSINNILVHQQLVVMARIHNKEKSLFDTYKSVVDMSSDNERIFFLYQYSTESSSIIITQKYGDVQALLQPKITVHRLNEDPNELKILITNALHVSLIPFDSLDIIKFKRRTFITASHSQLVQFNDNLLLKDVSIENPLIWIDTNSIWVLTINEYGHIPYPAVIHINYSNGKVYVTSNMNDIDAWFKQIEMESTEPFYELSSTDIDEKPLQKEIDFRKHAYDEQFAKELEMLHEESETLNEYGLGFDMNGLPIEMNN